jgi:hypothetical protein
LGHEWDKISGRSKLPLPFTVFNSAHFLKRSEMIDGMFSNFSGAERSAGLHRINLKVADGSGRDWDEIHRALRRLHLPGRADRERRDH